MILTHLAHFWSFCTWLVSVKVEFDTEDSRPDKKREKRWSSLGIWVPFMARCSSRLGLGVRLS